MIDRDWGAHVVVESMDLVRDSARPDDHRRTDLRIAVGARVLEIDISCVYQNQHFVPKLKLLIRQLVHRQLRHFVCQHRVNSGTCGGPGDILDPALRVVM